MNNCSHYLNRLGVKRTNHPKFCSELIKLEMKRDCGGRKAGIYGPATLIDCFCMDQAGFGGEFLVTWG